LSIDGIAFGKDLKNKGQVPTNSVNHTKGSQRFQSDAVWYNKVYMRPPPNASTKETIRTVKTELLIIIWEGWWCITGA